MPLHHVSAHPHRHTRTVVTLEGGGFVIERDDAASAMDDPGFRHGDHPATTAHHDAGRTGLGRERWRPAVGSHNREMCSVEIKLTDESSSEALAQLRGLLDDAFGINSILCTIKPFSKALLVYVFGHMSGYLLRCALIQLTCRFIVVIPAG